MEEKKIALLLAQPDEPYQQGLIRGAMKTAFAKGFSVTVFSMYIKYQNSRERELAESNIYNLIPLDQYDAIILFADLIQTPGVVPELEKRLHQEFPGPVVVVDRDSEFFYSFWTDGYDAVYAEVSHMIEEHGLKDIAYLTSHLLQMCGESVLTHLLVLQHLEVGLVVTCGQAKSSGLMIGCDYN